MKHIVKTREPLAFVNWKTSKKTEIDKKLAENVSGDIIFSLLLGNPPHPESSATEVVPFYKSNLRQVLLEEQGYICCYCNQGIANNYLTIIEHLNPKGKLEFRSQVFEYNNLLACCNGGERDTNKPRETYCTAKKGDFLLENWFISPLSPECDLFFGYDLQGKIFALNENNDARKTIEFLGLKAKSLELLKKKAIETYIYDILDDEMDIESEIQLLKSNNYNGYFIPFCMAIVGALKNY
jgi:uncharacterized protein (TIGR02646 family)